MANDFFIGVDGGASKTVVRIEDETGFVLGTRITSGSSIRFGAHAPWNKITQAVFEILANHEHSQKRLHIGIGIAGCEVRQCYQDFVNHPHSFTTICVKSDSHIACLGAHDGDDGAIIIVGTGSVGYQIQQKNTVQVGGWGFPHDDEGSGAWIGLQAIKHSLQTFDKRRQGSSLANCIYNFFENDYDRMLAWANVATPTHFAELAPFVIAQAELGDDDAIEILKNAAKAIDALAEALRVQQQATLPLALIGGIAPFITAYLSQNTKLQLRTPKYTPEIGAIHLIREFVQQGKL